MKTKKFLKSQKAAAMGEYAFLLVLIGLAVMPFVLRFGETNRTLFDDIAAYLDGTVNNPEQTETVYIYLDELEPFPQNDTTPITTNPNTGDIPSDSCGAWAIAVDTSDTSHFESGGDSDWWLLNVQAKSDLQFILQGEDLEDGNGAADLVNLTLRDIDGNALSSMRYGDPASHVQNQVEPGQYCIDAQSRNGSSVGGYRLTVNEISDIPYQIHEDNTAIGYDVIGTEEFQAGDQGDAWSIYVPEETDLVIRAYGGNANRRVRLITEDGTSLGTSSNSASIAARTWNNVEPGQYYVRVERLSGYDSYNLLIQSVDDLPSLYGVETLGEEPNTVVLNGPTETSTLYAGEYGDMHAVEVTSPGTLYFDVTSLGFLTNMRLYDSDFNELDFDISSSNGSVERVSTSATPGTYYLRITRRNGDSVGDYTVQARMP